MTTTEPTTERPTVKVGDFFVRSWGYDQTNINYYVVVGITPSGKSVKLREVGSKIVADHGISHDVVPNADGVRGECQHCWKWVRLSYVGESDRQFIVHNDGSVDCPEGNHVATPRIYTKRLQYTTWSSKPRPVVSWDSYSNAYLWEGGAYSETDSRFGH